MKKKRASKKLKLKFLKPTKIYSVEILKLTEKNLINSAAHITGGGLIENLTRSIPNHYSINIDLSKIKILDVFKWIKKTNLSDNEMMKTFNCGVGFCLIVKKKNVKKIQSYFEKKYKPYEIGYISKNNAKKINLKNSLKW